MQPPGILQAVRPHDVAGAGRLVLVDDAWTLLREGEGAKFLYRLAKAATQILMHQASQAIDLIADTFALIAGEAHMLLAAGRGEAQLSGRLPPRRVPDRRLRAGAPALR